MRIQLAGWIRMPDRHWRADIIAGLSLWGLVVPEALAYAGLAKLPPQAGLYTVVISLMVYAVFGASGLLVASATSASAAALGSVVDSIGGDDATKIASAVTLSVGLIYLLAWAFKAGFVVRLISRPVNTGLIFGLSIFVAVSQLGKLLGIKGADGNTIKRFWYLLSHLNDTNVASLLVGCGALALLFLLPLINFKLPVGLSVLVLGILVSMLLKLHDKFDVEVVGKLPTGLPHASIPRIGPGQWAAVLGGAAGVTLIALSEAASVGQDLARSREENYDLDDDLFAFGAGNVANSVFGGMVGAGSLSASSVNQAAGARTQFSSAVASIAALCTLLFLGGVLRDLPEAILGALIVHAVARHLVPTVIIRIRRYSNLEYRMALIAVVGVLLFDALGGLLIAMMINLAVFVHRTYATSVSEVGALAGVARLVRISEHPKAESKEGVLALRVNNALFFGNAVGAVGAVRQALSKANADGRNIHSVIFDLSTQTALDMTSASALVDLSDEMHRQGIDFQFIEVHSRVRRDLVEARRLEHREAQLDLSRGDGDNVPDVDANDSAVDSSRERPQGSARPDIGKGSEHSHEASADEASAREASADEADDDESDDSDAPDTAELSSSDGDSADGDSVDSASEESDDAQGSGTAAGDDESNGDDPDEGAKEDDDAMEEDDAGRSN